jgi:hypothetical protein
VAVDGACLDLLLAPDAAGEFVFAEDACRVAGELDEQLELQAAEARRRVVDVDGACGEVDVDLADLQMAAGDRLKRAARERGEDRSQQQIAGVVCEVVVAAALIGPQDGQLVVVAPTLPIATRGMSVARTSSARCGAGSIRTRSVMRGRSSSRSSIGRWRRGCVRTTLCARLAGRRSVR